MIVYRTSSIQAEPVRVALIFAKTAAFLEPKILEPFVSVFTHVKELSRRDHQSIWKTSSVNLEDISC